MANWIYNLLHGKLPGKGFLGRSSTDSGPGELLDPAAARSLLGSSGRDFATIAAAEAATYTEPEHCAVKETGKAYIYDAASTATVDHDYVLSVGDAVGRLIAFTLGYARVGQSDWATTSSAFGQPYNRINELMDWLFRATDRFTVTSANVANVPSLFDGSFDTNYTCLVTAGTTGSIEIDLRTGAGYNSGYGVLYAEGYVLVSFYHTHIAYDDVRAYTTVNYNGTPFRYELTSVEDVSINSSYRVLKFRSPGNVYMGKIEVEVDASSTGLCALAAINFVSTRQVTTPLPYVSSYLPYSWIYGSLNINNNILLDRNGGATFGGKVNTDNTTEATTATDGSLQTDGGLSVVKNAVIGSNLSVGSGSAPTARIHAKAATADSSTFIAKKEDSAGKLLQSLRADGRYFHDGAIARPALTITTDTTLTVATRAFLLLNFAAAGGVVTLPASPEDGQEFHPENIGAFAVTLARNGKLINGAASNVSIGSQSNGYYKYDTASGSWWSFD